MPFNNSNPATITALAEAVGLNRWQVSYAARQMKIRPVTFAGVTAVYDATDAARILEHIKSNLPLYKKRSGNRRLKAAQGRK